MILHFSESHTTNLLLTKSKVSCLYVVSEQEPQTVFLSTNFKINTVTQGVIHVSKEKNLNKPLSVSHNPESNFFEIPIAVKYTKKVIIIFHLPKMLASMFSWTIIF